jgi:hypothetical protein
MRIRPLSIEKIPKINRRKTSKKLSSSATLKISLTQGLASRAYAVMKTNVPITHWTPHITSER